MIDSFVISDTHFNHKNIIQYCHRPFVTIEEMNEAIVSNWNKVVLPTDSVYFLGDWGMGNVGHWIKQLRGNIISVQGSHDKVKSIRYAMLEVDGIRMLFVHNPDNVSFDGWIVHGHKHNNDLNTFPFINIYKRTINVSVEIVNYTPIRISEILQCIESRSR